MQRLKSKSNYLKIYSSSMGEIKKEANWCDLCCYNRIPEIRSLIMNRGLCLVVVQIENPVSRCQHQISVFLLHYNMAERERGETEGRRKGEAGMRREREKEEGVAITVSCNLNTNTSSKYHLLVVLQCQLNLNMNFEEEKH